MPLVSVSELPAAQCSNLETMGCEVHFRPNVDQLVESSNLYGRAILWGFVQAFWFFQVKFLRQDTSQHQLSRYRPTPRAERICPEAPKWSALSLAIARTSQHQCQRLPLYRIDLHKDRLEPLTPNDTVRQSAERIVGRACILLTKRPPECSYVMRDLRLTGAV